MATYNNATTVPVNTILQQDNNSWECLPKYNSDQTTAYQSSNVSTTNSSNSSLQKLKARISSITEARDRRASLYEAWQRKLPTLYAKQTGFVVASYPPHKAEFARQQRIQSSNGSTTESDTSKTEELKYGNYHQSWYPHYKISEHDPCSEPDADKVEDLKESRRHQSWYPHYASSAGTKAAKPNASKVNSLNKHTRHQSWYPHYKPSSNVAA